jgi:Kef-type K+ transport system membrane component KefB
MFLVGMDMDFDTFRAKLKPAIFSALMPTVSCFIFAIPLLWVLDSEEFTGKNSSKALFLFFFFPFFFSPFSSFCARLHVEVFRMILLQIVLYLFLGVVMALTSLPVLARILGEYHLQGTPFGIYTLTAAATGDIIAFPLLSVAIALSSAVSSLSILWVFLLLLGDAVFVAAFVFPVMKFIERRSRGAEHFSQFTIFLIFVVLFSSAFLTEIFGISYVIGAFQALHFILFYICIHNIFSLSRFYLRSDGWAQVGLMMPRNSVLLADLSSKLEDVVVILFMPGTRFSSGTTILFFLRLLYWRSLYRTDQHAVFFTMSGLRTQLADISSLDLWLITLLIIALATVGTLTGAVPAGRLFGKLSWPDSISFGFLMNTKVHRELLHPSPPPPSRVLLIF